MINISRLYCGQITPGDKLRYGQGIAESDGGDSRNFAGRKPVVVWNVTQACNLNCIHCYSDSSRAKADDELTTGQARRVLQDLGQFGVPVVLFSGGEPLMREDLFELLADANLLGLRTVLSTNGTLITEDIAARLAECGVGYVGVSFDGIGEVNDKFRGAAGAFERAVKGIRYCRDAGVRVGLRFTLTQSNTENLEEIFDFLQAERIERACFYHLVPVGRASKLAAQQLGHSQTRHAVDTILARTRAMAVAGRATDILTVDNHADAAYLYQRLLFEEPEKARAVWPLLAANGGALSSGGVGIGCIDWSGKVHPDQFWRHYTLGDVRKRPFSRIWTDTDEPLLAGLRNRRSFIKGRCRLCRFFEICGGGLRVRADLHFQDTWAPDPACYLTDEEIGLDDSMREQLRRSGEVYEMPR